MDVIGDENASGTTTCVNAQRCETALEVLSLRSLRWFGLAGRASIKVNRRERLSITRSVSYIDSR